MAFNTQILPVEKWHLVEPVVRAEFGNAMPQTPEQATFLTALDGDRLAGFIPVEQLYFFGSIYVAPEYRTTRLAWQLMREAASLIPKGFSAAVLTDRPELVHLVERLGARDRGEWRFLRKDF